MGLSTLRVGVTIRIGDRENRLLGSPDGKTWQLENIKTRFISQMATPDLLQGLEQGTIAFVSGGTGPVKGAAKLVISGADFEVAKLRLAYVRPLLEGPLSKRRGHEAIQQVHKAIKKPSIAPSLSSVRRWIELYRRAGSDIRALVDQTQKKGNRAPRYPEEVIREVDDSIASKCLQRTCGTLESALNQGLV